VALQVGLPKMAGFEKVFIRESFFSADCKKKSFRVKKIWGVKYGK